MKDADIYSRESGYVCEYDNYPIPPYDPSLSDDERKAKAAEARKRLQEILDEL